MAMKHPNGRLSLRALAGLGLAALTTIAVAACSGPADPGTDEPTTFTMATSSSGLAPDFSNYSALQLFAAFQAVYDYPMHFDPATQELEPWMVTDWSYDDSRTTLTMNIRDDMVFSNGDPVTAADLKANFDQRVALMDGGFNYTNIVSIEAPSDTQVVIQLAQPDYFFLAQVAATHISHPSAMESKDAPLGSGPYVLDKEKTVAGSSYVFTRNPEYWNPEAFAYDEVVIKVMADVTARVNALVSGQVDYAPIDANTAAAAEERGFEVFRNYATSATLLIFDRAGTLVPALGDPAVRRALQYAIDREAIAESIDNGDGNPQDQYFLEGQPWYVEDAGEYTYDPEKAKQLLAEAGYPDGFVIGDVPSLWFPEYEPAVEQYLADVGVTINFVTGPLEDSVPGLLAGEVPTVVWNNGVWLPSNELLPTGVWNPLRYTNPDVDGFLERINGGTPEEAAAANAEFGQYIYDNAWAIQIAHPASYFAADASKVDVSLAGLQAFSGFDGIYLWDVKPAG